MQGQGLSVLARRRAREDATVLVLRRWTLQPRELSLLPHLPRQGRRVLSGLCQGLLSARNSGRSSEFLDSLFRLAIFGSKFAAIKCNKAHITECPDYSKEQKCPRGNLCPLAHRNGQLKKCNKRKRTKSAGDGAGGKMCKSSSTKLSEKSVDAAGMAAAMDFAASFIAFNPPVVTDKSSESPAATQMVKPELPQPVIQGNLQHINKLTVKIMTM